MRTTMIRRFGVVPLLFLLAPSVLLAGEPVATRRFSLDADRLRVVNLIGEIRIERASGDSFDLTAEVFGKDATETTLTFDVEEGSEGALTVVYPRDASRFVYPPMGRGSNASFSRKTNRPQGDWLSWVLPGGDSDRIRVAGSGSGTEVWADLTIRVPEGKELVLLHGAGEITARSVAGNLDLSTHVGRVSVQSIQGDVRVDTGSGSVTAKSIRGSLSVDTGSGSVDLADCSGPRIVVDTGSGSVDGVQIDTGELSIDTGSGGIEVHGLTADRVTMDTGSGAIDASFEQVGGGPIDLDTGAGGIDLEIPPSSAIDLRAETASGGIRVVGLDGARFLTKEHDEIHATTGDGGTPITLDTGSGGIEVRVR